MKTHTTTTTTTTALLLSLTLLAGNALAQHAGHHTAAAPAAAPADAPAGAPAAAPAAASPAPAAAATATTPAADALPWTEAEVRRVDVRTGKVTLKHGDIVNLGMPPMTMAFQASEPAALANVKVGDRVRFTADHIKGVYTVLRIEPLP